MADTKISNLPEATSMSDDDIFVVVDSPGGSPVTKKITKSNLFTDVPTENTTYNVTAPITLVGTTIAMPKATTSVNGYLSSTDWDTFNDKADASTLSTHIASSSIHYIKSSINLGDLGDVVSTTSAGYGVYYNGTTSKWTPGAVSGGGGGAVDSVFTRTGAVVSAIGDYTKEQITGLKTTDTPAFDGLNSTDNIIQTITHGDNMKLYLSAANNGGGTGECSLYSWVSEPAATWTGAGIARNMSNTSASFPRINTSLSGQMLHFTEAGNTELAFITSAGVSTTPFVFYPTGALTVGGIATFGAFPITPSSAPTTNYQVANKKYVDDNASGDLTGMHFYVDTINSYLTTSESTYTTMRSIDCTSAGIDKKCYSFMVNFKVQAYASSGAYIRILVTDVDDGETVFHETGVGYYYASYTHSIVSSKKIKTIEIQGKTSAASNNMRIAGNSGDSDAFEVYTSNTTLLCLGDY